MLAKGISLRMSTSRMVSNSGLMGGLKLKPNSASTMRLYESRIRVGSEGRYDRNGMSNFSHCDTRFAKSGLLGRFG